MFSFEKDQGREFEVSHIIGSREFRNYIRSAVENLPEYRAAKEIAEKFDVSMAIKYVLFVGVNDWGLTWVHYGDYKGSDALWHATKDALIELGTFNVDKLTQHVLEKLHFSSGKRRIYFEKISRFIGSEQVLALINDWIKTKVIDEDSLRQVLENIQNEIEKKIPVDKILNLIMRTYSYFLKPLGFKVKAKETVIFDVHVAKVTLRLGLVKAKPKASFKSKYIPVGFPLTGNRMLKQKVIEAWNEISKSSGVSVWDIDVALWYIGKNFCLFDDELLQQNSNINPNQLQKTSCPYRRLGLELRCPLRDACESYRSEIGLRILSQRVASESEVVLFLDNLRKLL